MTQARRASADPYARCKPEEPSPPLRPAASPTYGELLQGALEN